MPDRTDDLDERPSTSPEEERAEAKELTRGWLRVGGVSIVATVLALLVAMQATGLVDVVPFGDDWTYEWLVFALIAVALVGFEVWGWRTEGP